MVASAAILVRILTNISPRTTGHRCARRALRCRPRPGSTTGRLFPGIWRQRFASRRLRVKTYADWWFNSGSPDSSRRDTVLGPEPPEGTRERGLGLASQRNGDPDCGHRTRAGNRIFGWRTRSDNSAKQEDHRRRRGDHAPNMNARASTKVRTCPGEAHEGRHQAEHGSRQVMRDEQETAAVQQRCREPPHRSAEERGGHGSARQGWCRHGRS